MLWKQIMSFQLKKQNVNRINGIENLGLNCLLWYEGNHWYCLFELRANAFKFAKFYIFKGMHPLIWLQERYRNAKFLKLSNEKGIGPVM